MVGFDNQNADRRFYWGCFIMNKVLLILLLSFISLVNAESLYLGHDNVKCGNYIINEDSELDDVHMHCDVIKSMPENGGVVVAKIRTEEDGIITCKFIKGQLKKCHTK